MRGTRAKLALSGVLTATLLRELQGFGSWLPVRVVWTVAAAVPAAPAALEQIHLREDDVAALEVVMKFLLQALHPSILRPGPLSGWRA